MTATEINTELTKLTQDLIYISESESPLEVLPWKVKDKEDLLRQIASFTSQPKDRLQEVDVASFFASIRQMANPNDEAITAYAKRYDALYTFLTQHMERLQVIRAGQVQVQIFIAAFNSGSEGGAMVLHTTAIES